MTWDRVTYRFFSPIFMGGMLCGCIEPFEATFIDFESVLVVDATLTNEIKQQQIILTRTYELEADGPIGESGALLQVVAGNGVSFDFIESENGNYFSELPFAAQPNTQYTLFITTRDGSVYQSEEAAMGNMSQIDSLYAQRIINDFGEEGIGIFLNTRGIGDSTNFYRYEYEETYKIVAPFYTNDDLSLSDEGAIIITPRPPEELTCFPSATSNTIILADTEDLDDVNVTNFLVRFINRNNYIITHRYSILVRQYSQSQEPHTFYKNLSNFATSENLFSETQPGFLSGNLSSKANSVNKVLGYFNVAAIDEKRIFFNYEDFFPGERLPPYVNPCNLSSPPDDKIPSQVRLNLIKYVKDNDGEFTGPVGSYIIVPRVCGDCTVLGSPEIPEFWIE
ncbi:DUF4249 domain-containing protein [Flagellimonas meishanensis]|uniref:DUF4249 domain-containing protein n=1 Tax=Flagellimonas meishanensis TaxID=2873264 RepID=UPI00223BE3F5|nr:DUF4249 domain-containing protein [[Muricauda] meishanensis]